MYIIFLFEIFPTLFTLCCAYDYLLLAITKDARYSESLQSKYDCLLKYPFIGIIGLLVATYTIYDCFFSAKQYSIESVWKTLNLFFSLCNILCFIQTMKLIINRKSH